jgi:hypothetical protein
MVNSLGGEEKQDRSKEFVHGREDTVQIKIGSKNSRRYGLKPLTLWTKVA